MLEKIPLTPEERKQLWLEHCIDHEFNECMKVPPHYKSQGLHCRTEAVKNCEQLAELESFEVPSKIETGFNAKPLIVTLLILGIGWLIFRQS